jgi:ParB family chromosome partitioning protein
MSKPTKPRLGRGLSSLLSSTLDIEAPSAPILEPTPSAGSISPQNRVDRPDVRWISTTAISVSPFQPRRQPEQAELETLAASIRSMGVMQPVLVRPLPARSSNAAAPGAVGWELVAGERRWRAAQLAELDRIPATIIDIDDKSAAEWGIAENLQREDLSPIEQGWALRKLVERFGQSHTEIASALGIARASVSNLIRLTDLEPETQELLLKGDISAGHAKVLLSVQSAVAQKRFAALVVKHHWSVRALEEAIQRAGNTRTPSVAARTEPRADIVELERQLAEHLGTKVRLRSAVDGKRGSLTIEFFGADGFDDLAQRIGFVMRS